MKLLNDRYHLLSVIKQGGFGIIYKGYDTVLAKDIAVKQIHPEFLEEARYVDLFLLEARLVARMNHPNIVHILDLVRTPENGFYIVMEYIDGLDLRKILSRCRQRGIRLPKRFGLYVVAEVCKALDYAHNLTDPTGEGARGVIHQDISPSNIMVSQKGAVKLIDFGVAGLHNAHFDNGSELHLRGKIQYMSPEHVDPQHPVDTRSDLFSLGLVLYEVLKGERFFRHETPEEIVQALQNGRLKSKAAERFPAALRTILQRMLDPDPDQRYQSANQAYIDLMMYLISEWDLANVEAELRGFVAELEGAKPETAARKGASAPGGSKREPRRRPPKRRPTPQPPEPEIAVGEDDPFEDPASPADQHGDLQFDEPIIGMTDGAIWAQPPAEPPRETTPAATAEQEAQDILNADDEIKTVIDIARLPDRGREGRRILPALAVGVAAALLLLALDTLFRWTAVGSGFYDALFPPTIKIRTIPAGATVFLNGEPVPGSTPLSIDDLSPGVYELKLTSAHFAPIVKSVQVFGSGDVAVKGVQNRKGDPLYLFRFKTKLEINSVPPGADVYLNGIKYGQQTPCTVTWEVGEPCEIEMRRSGFAALTNYALDTEHKTDEVEDRRLWKLEVLKEPHTSFRVTGAFAKGIALQSNPEGAAIYVDEKPQPAGVTGGDRSLFITAGTHKIVLKKRGYLAREIELTVDEDTPEKLVFDLRRPVQFYAYNDAGEKDIGATVVRLIRGGRTFKRNEQTPCRINLLPYAYTAVLAKTGYEEARVQIGPEDKVVIARLKPRQADVVVAVLDAGTGAPVSGVIIHARSLDQPNAPQRIFNITDSEGTCSGALTPGLYLFRTEIDTHTYQEKSVMIQAGDLNLIEFNLERP